ncbi:MAG TPA: cell division protein FtsH, partial [Lachnospiraceae bacterium]|nr:cell division protein FtsH [Lachnospiraceae bacterium]
MENKKKTPGAANLLFRYLFIFAFIMIILYVIEMIATPKVADYSVVSFNHDLKEGIVTSVEIYPSKGERTGRVIVSLNNGKTKQFFTTNVNDVTDSINKSEFDENITLHIHEAQKESLFEKILPYIFCLVVMMMCFFLISGMLNGLSGGGGANSRLANFNKSHARMVEKDDNNISFANVAGLEEEKAELAEIVDFLKDPKKYIAVGAKIPKGILLEGVPGTGKTLLAKAVAGEAGVTFFTISGSDFVEMFVGVGASRVRDLFNDAKLHKPCVVFIDEIDAVARRRGTGMGGGHDEREQTLNQLLVEMDGFEDNSGIVVLAATNRVDILDPAILRPGRFDRKIVVGRPDVKGRTEILKVHAKDKMLSDDVNLDDIARITAGFTGADLANLLNEAAIKAAGEGRSSIKDEDIKKSLIRVGIGTEKKSRVVSDLEKKIVAYHEAGHAILFHVLPHVGPVYTVSIIPTGEGAGGYTMPLPEKDDMLITKGKMLEEITVSLGGRIAESMIFDDITTGASGDIRQATRAARAMVTKYGFSDKVGEICYDNDDDEV